MKEHEERILGRLEAVGEASAPEIAEFLGVSRQSAFRYLSALVEQGVVVRHGAGRATRYELVEELRLDDVAVALDREAQDATHLQLVGTQFRSSADDAKFALPFDYMLVDRGSDQYDRHGFFAPMMETSERQYPLPLAEVDADIIALWEGLASLVAHPYVRARLNDLLWVRRWGDRPHEFAQQAIDAYVAMGDVGGLDYADALTRAYDIALSLPDPDRAEIVVRSSIDAARSALAVENPKPGIFLGLIAPALSSVDQDAQSEAAQLLIDARSIFEDPWIQEKLIQSLLSLSGSVVQDGTDRLPVEAVGVWLDAAEAEQGTLKKHFKLQKALEVAMFYRLSDLARNIRMAIQEAAPIEDEMQQISAEIEVPRDQMEEAFEWIAAGQNWPECLVRLVGLGPLSGRLNHNREAVERHASEFPLSRLMSSQVVGPTNSTIFRVETDVDRDEFDLSNYEAMAISISSHTVASSIDRVKTRHGMPSKTALTEFFTTELIPAEVAERLAASVGHFLNGDYDECVLVALPRIEAVVRNMVARTGQSVWSEPGGRSRFGQQHPLGRLLTNLAGNLDEDWLRYLWTLLSNPLGPNLRNLHLHGLILVGTREHGAALIQVMSFLALIGPIGDRDNDDAGDESDERDS